ncbi:hypothetical protein ES703_28995 [subsurface metagenome]
MTKPPEVKGVTPKEIHQAIKSENLWEVDLDADPKYVPWMYISNIIGRVLARIAGQGPEGPVTVKCTADGSLAVVQRGGAFDDYQKLEHDFVRLSTGTTTSDKTDHLVDSGATFQTDLVAIGDSAINTTDNTDALVTAVNSQTELKLSKDIMDNSEAYDVIQAHQFTFAQQVTRIDIFTYDGKVNYQLTRDAVKPYGAPIELFEDSFYSLDFFTLKVNATAVTWTAATPTRSKVMGWFREGG